MAIKSGKAQYAWLALVLVVAGVFVYTNHRSQMKQQASLVSVGNVFEANTPCDSTGTQAPASVEDGLTITNFTCDDQKNGGSTIEYELTSEIADSSDTTGIKSVYDQHCSQTSNFTAGNGAKTSYIDQQTAVYNGITFKECALENTGTIFEVDAVGISSGSFGGAKLAAVDISVSPGDTAPSAGDLWSRLNYVLGTIQFQ